MPDVVDLRDTRDERLLEVLYRDLYLPNFPIAEQQEDPSIWTPLLWGPLPPPPKPILHILVAGERLHQATRRQIHGFIVLEFFRLSGCGLLTYMAVHHRVRRQGVGRLLLARAIRTLEADAAAHGVPLRAVFGEVNDPARVQEGDDSMNGGERLEVLERMGARRVPIHYVQPQLRPGQGRSGSLFFVAFPADSKPLRVLPADVLRAFLAEFYRALGVASPDDDPDFRASLASLRGEQIVLLPLRPTSLAEE